MQLVRIESTRMALLSPPLGHIGNSIFEMGVNLLVRKHIRFTATNTMHVCTGDSRQLSDALSANETQNMEIRMQQNRTTSSPSTKRVRIALAPKSCICSIVFKFESNARIQLEIGCKWKCVCECVCARCSSKNTPEKMVRYRSDFNDGD